MRIITAVAIFAAATSIPSFGQEAATAAFVGANSAVKTASMSVEDFIVDKQELNGKNIVVSGSASCLNGDICYLSSVRPR